MITKSDFHVSRNSSDFIPLMSKKIKSSYNFITKNTTMNQKLQFIFSTILHQQVKIKLLCLLQCIFFTLQSVTVILFIFALWFSQSIYLYFEISELSFPWLLHVIVVSIYCTFYLQFNVQKFILQELHKIFDPFKDYEHTRLGEERAGEQKNAHLWLHRILRQNPVHRVFALILDD